MTTEAALQFIDSERLGCVEGVDTSRVSIRVDNPSLLTRTSIGNLIAIKGITEREYLIGLVERVTRSLRDHLVEPSPEVNDLEIQQQPDDVIRAVLIGTYRTVDGDRVNTYKRGADSFPQIDRDCFLVESENLQRFMGLLGKDLAQEERLELGHFVAARRATAIASGDKFFQRHASILGSTGSGKSWAVALILERASRLKHPNLVIFDMHGEYAPLTTATGFATRLRIAGPGDEHSTEPDILFLPYWLLNSEEMMSMFLDRTDQNAPNQTSRFMFHLRNLKSQTLEAEVQVDVRKTFTVDSPVPYELDKLIYELREDDTRKSIGANNREIKGEWEGKLTRMISRLEAKVDDRRYGFLFRPPAEAQRYDWMANQMRRLLGAQDARSGIKVIDFSEVPSDVIPIVAGVLARILYSVQYWMKENDRTPFTLVCDEAHLYLPVKSETDALERQSLEVFEKIAKEGRKYGTSLLVVSQRPSDVSRTILSQCNNFLVLRLTNEEDQSVIRRLMPDSMAGLTDLLPLLETGEALLLGDAVLLPTRIRLDSPSVQPASATREFWTEWGSRRPDVDAIASAVETLRKQSRGTARAMSASNQADNAT